MAHETILLAKEETRAWTHQLLVYPAMLVVLAAVMLFGSSEDRWSPAVAFQQVCLLQPFLLCLVVPFLLAGRPESVPLAPHTQWVSAVIFAETLGFLALSAAATGGMPMATSASLAVFLGGFSALVAGLYALLRACHVPVAVSQALVSSAGLFLVFSFLLVGEFVRIVENQGPLRAAAIEAVLWTNPVTSIASGFFGQDLFRLRPLYDISPVEYYPYAYPSWTAVLAGYAATGVLLGLGGCVILRLRRIPIRLRMGMMAHNDSQR